MILGWKRNSRAPQVGRILGAKKAFPSDIRSRAEPVEGQFVGATSKDSIVKMLEDHLG